MNLVTGFTPYVVAWCRVFAYAPQGKGVNFAVVGVVVRFTAG